MKIPKNTLRDLKKIAKTLPPVPIRDKEGKEIKIFKVMLGSEILALNPKATDEHNEILNPNKKYRMPVDYKKVNHFRRLKSNYLSGGTQGVEDYIQQVRKEL